MCEPATGSAGSGRNYFEPDIKCCDHMPELPNFLVGRVLLDASDGNASGRASVGARIDAGEAVTPLGLGVPDSWSALARKSAGAFGHSHALRCPHFVEEDSLCGVWAHRESVCSTYFCKHVRGATGESFWMALRELLVTIEHELAHWCVERMGFDDASLERLLGRGEGSGDVDSGAPDMAADPERQRAIWGAWLGRERELYERSARLVEELDWEDVLEIGGRDLGQRVSALRAAWGQLVSTGTPDFLQAGSWEIVDSTPGSVTLRSYSASDLLEIPRALFDALGTFDGGPAAEALERIERERGVRIGPERIRELVDFRLLRPEGAGDSPA
jgi:Fe-S-cluster containining protein